jgi:hypothetical protein
MSPRNHLSFPKWQTEWSVTRALAVRFGGAEHVPPAALERGTLVHEWTANTDQHGLNPNPSHNRRTRKFEMPRGLEGYCYAWQDFMEASKPAWLKIESALESESLGYHGIVDRFGFLYGKPNKVVLDIKTGGPRNADRYQLAAYSLLIQPPPLLTRIGLYIKADGTWTLKQYDDISDYITWMEILNEAKESKNGKHGTRQTKQ